jgi:hypothetical protein
MADKQLSTHAQSEHPRGATHCGRQARNCGIVVLVLIVGAALLPTIINLFQDAAYHFSAFTDEGLVTADARDLKTTVVVAHRTHRLLPDQNVVWCATFQLAWNKLCRRAGGSVRLATSSPLVDLLNTQDIGPDDVDNASYVAAAGALEEGIYDKIDTELKRTFGGDAAPQLARSEKLIRPQDVFAYAYLFKDLRFAKPFEVLSRPLIFGGEGVRCFGIEAGKAVPAALLDQVRIFEYDRESGQTIIELVSTSKDDQLVLAMITPKDTLAETITAVLAQITQREGLPAYESDVLKVPKFNFDLTRSYDELIGQAIVSTNVAMPSDGVIVEALQTIRFQLDEKGARLRSESEVSIGCGEKGTPRQLVFNQPFLLMMKLRDADDPYFAMWVDNAELMAKAE